MFTNGGWMETMKITIVIAYFRTKTMLASVLGISLPAVSKWGEIIPKGRAYEIQALTNGALIVDPSLYPVRQARFEYAEGDK